MADGIINNTGIKILTRTLTVNSTDPNHMATIGISLPNVPIAISIPGIICTGFTTYAGSWICCLTEYDLTKKTSGSYSATIYYL